MRKVLLCPPSNFEIDYEINPWMDIHNKIDKKKVHEQYQSLKSVYKNLNVEVFEIEPQIGLPDMVYTANYGSIQNGFFIKSNFRYPQRRKEAEIAQKFLENHFSYKTAVLSSDIYFEGQAELFKVENKYFFGWGQRSDFKAKKQLEEILDCYILGLHLTNPYYYHLDTCFAPISKDLVILNPAAFEKKGLKKISENFANVISINSDNKKAMPCNLVVVDNNVIVGEGMTNSVKTTIKNHGFNVIEIDTGEYIKGGGSIRCLTLDLN